MAATPHQTPDTPSTPTHLSSSALPTRLADALDIACSKLHQAACYARRGGWSSAAHVPPSDTYTPTEPHRPTLLSLCTEYQESSPCRCRRCRDPGSWRGPRAAACLWPASSYSFVSKHKYRGHSHLMDHLTLAWYPPLSLFQPLLLNLQLHRRHEATGYSSLRRSGHPRPRRSGSRPGAARRRDHGGS